MPLVATTLADGLKEMTPADNEGDAITAFADAFEAYFSEATVLGIAVNGGSLANARSAMEIALVGMSASGAGATKIQAGITAFWGVVAASAAAIWTMVPPVPPPTGATPPTGLSGIASALTTVFTNNTSSEADLDTAATNIANEIHPTQLGGIALIPPPPPPTNPGPQPIV